jgi:hypothetical protein
VKATWILLAFVCIMSVSYAQNPEQTIVPVAERMDEIFRSHSFQPDAMMLNSASLNKVILHLDSLELALSNYIELSGLDSTDGLPLEIQRTFAYLEYLSMRSVEGQNSNSSGHRISDTLVDLKWLHHINSGSAPRRIVHINTLSLDTIPNGMNQHLWTERPELPYDATTYINQISDMKFASMPAFQGNLKVGLGLGFYSFLKSPSRYVVGENGYVQTLKYNGGLNMMLDGQVVYDLNKNHSILFSLPLATISGQSELKIGLLSKRLASGLGYTYRTGTIGFYTTLLVAPFEQINEDAIEHLKIDQVLYSELRSSDYPSEVRYFGILSFGVQLALR